MVWTPSLANRAASPDLTPLSEVMGVSRPPSAVRTAAGVGADRRARIGLLLGGTSAAEAVARALSSHRRLPAGRSAR